MAGNKHMAAYISPNLAFSQAEKCEQICHRSGLQVSQSSLH